MNPTRTTSNFAAPRSLQNQRARIFVSGSDPLFSGGSRRKAPRDWSRQGVNASDTLASPFWNTGFLDRLQPTLTRRHE